MLTKYIKNEQKFYFNEDGTIKEGFINGKQLAEDDLVEIKLAEKTIQEKLTTLSAEYKELEEQKNAIVTQQKELADKYSEEFNSIRNDLMEKVFSKYSIDTSSKEVGEWGQENIFWWIYRWI